MRLVLAALLLAGLMFGQIPSKTPGKTPLKREGLFPSLEFEVIPHITKGANWTSKFVLFNVSTVDAPYKMVFYNPVGEITSIPLKDRGAVTEVSGTLKPGGSVWFETEPDSSPNETQYWSRLTEGNAYVQGLVIFSWNVPGRTPVEVTVPLTDEWLADSAWVPFNNTEGFKTALALTNTDNEIGIPSPETVVIEAYDPDGNLLVSRDLTLEAGHKTAFILPDKYPELANHRGSVRVRKSGVFGVDIAFLALQFHPAGSITLVLPFDQSGLK